MRDSLIVIQDGNAFDILDLCNNITWSGRIGTPTRSLKVTLLDDERGRYPRSCVNIEKGTQCIYSRENKELFRGIFLRQEQGSGRMMTLIAYDNGIYLSNNKDSFLYENKTASFIFEDVCKRFNIPYGRIDNTEYIIDELPKSRTTGFDVIADALASTYEATSRRFSVVCNGEKMELISREENFLQWVISTDANVMDYDYSVDMEKIKTRINLIDSDDKVVVSKSDPELEKLIGMFQEVATADKDMSEGKLNELAANMLKEQGRAKKSLSVNALGIDEIIAGTGVFVRIPHLDIVRTFYVEGDNHSYKDGYHTMKLDLLEKEEFLG